MTSRSSLETIVPPLPPAGLDPLGVLNQTLMGATRRARLARAPFEVVPLVMEVVEMPFAARHPSPGVERGASVWGFSPSRRGGGAESHVVADRRAAMPPRPRRFSLLPRDCRLSVWGGGISRV